MTRLKQAGSVFRAGLAQHSGRSAVAEYAGRCVRGYLLALKTVEAFCKAVSMSPADPDLRSSDVRVWNRLYTTYLWAGVSCLVEQFSRCDPLKLIP